MSLHFSWQSAVLHSGISAGAKLTMVVVGSFMNQHGKGAWPSMSTIAALASLSKSSVKRHLSEAEQLGWIGVRRRSTKNGDKDTNEYEIRYPEGGVTVNLGGSMMNPPGGSTVNPGGATMSQRVGSPWTINTPVVTPHKKEDTDAPRRVSSEGLIQDGIKPELAKAFLAHRKAKKAPLTELAYAGIKREAKAAGWELADALLKAIERNWIGFESGWVEKRGEAAVAPGIAAAGHSDVAWWESTRGIEGKGQELQVRRRPEWDFQTYRVHVLKAAGPGSWREALLADLLRTKSSAYARVYEFFNGNPPMEAAA